LVSQNIKQEREEEEKEKKKMSKTLADEERQR